MTCRRISPSLARTRSASHDASLQLQARQDLIEPPPPPLLRRRRRLCLRSVWVVQVHVRSGVFHGRRSKRKFLENTFKKDDYTRFDLGVSHTLKYDQDLEMVFRFNVENIFDTEYYAGGGSTSDDYEANGAQNVVVGEGRNFMATVQVRY